MTSINEEITKRRQVWANTALEDPLLTPERRCYGVFHQVDLSSGQITSCYTGAGYLEIPLLSQPRYLKLDILNGQLIAYGAGSVSNAVKGYYGLTSSALVALIDMSDGKSSVEEINAKLLALPITWEA